MPWVASKGEGPAILRFAPRASAWITLAAGVAIALLAYRRSAQELPLWPGLLVAFAAFLSVWAIDALLSRADRGAQQAALPLRRQLEQARGVLDSAIDGILTIDDRGVILSVNSAVEAIFGYRGTEIVGQKLTLLLSEECRETYSPGLGTSFRVGHEEIVGRIVEITGVGKDGKRVPIDLSIWEVRTQGERIYTGIVRNISERKRMQGELEESNLQLRRTIEELRRTQDELVTQERLRALGTMASGIAHDFNNFLAPILGFTELLLLVPGALDDREKVRRYLDLIQTSAKSAAGVVASLREFYRKRAASERKAPTDLNRLVTEAIELTRPRWKDMSLARGAQVRCEAHTAPDLPKIAANEVEIRNVLANLVFNAVDALPSGGCVTLSTWTDREEVVLEVRDDGTGMPEDVRQRCLEPFFTTKGEKGTGLGLAVVHAVVERHGGRLEIESAAGKGTTVRIRFPIGANDASGGAEARPKESPAGLSVLVADDEPLLREMLSGYLATAGHRVEEASNGREALEKFHLGRFDLVLTDMGMPEMTGLQLAQNVKRAAPAKPVILLTGMGEVGEGQEGLPEGVDAVLSKPITLPALLQAVASAVAKSAPQDGRR